MIILVDETYWRSVHHPGFSISGLWLLWLRAPFNDPLPPKVTSLASESPASSIEAQARPDGDHFGLGSTQCSVNTTDQCHLHVAEEAARQDGKAKEKGQETQPPYRPFRGGRLPTFPKILSRPQRTRLSHEPLQGQETTGGEREGQGKSARGRHELDWENRTAPCCADSATSQRRQDLCFSFRICFAQDLLELYAVK